MASFWKFKAWLQNWVGRFIMLAILVGIVLGLIFLKGPILSVWSMIARNMGFGNYG